MPKSSCGILPRTSLLTAGRLQLYVFGLPSLRMRCLYKSIENPSLQLYRPSSIIQTLLRHRRLSTKCARSPKYTSSGPNVRMNLDMSTAAQSSTKSAITSRAPSSTARTPKKTRMCNGAQLDARGIVRYAQVRACTPFFNCGEGESRPSKTRNEGVGLGVVVVALGGLLW